MTNRWDTLDKGDDARDGVGWCEISSHYSKEGTL